MKKIIGIYFIIGIIFISGCIGGEKSPQSDTQAPKLIIKPDDVPGFMLFQYSFIAINKSSPVNFNFSSNRRREPYEVDGMEYYQDAIKKDMRNIGEKSTWRGKNIQQVNYILIKYDSNSGFKDWFDYMQTLQKARYVIEVGSPQIGDFSIYVRSMGDIKDGGGKHFNKVCL